MLRRAPIVPALACPFLWHRQACARSPDQEAGLRFCRGVYYRSDGRHGLKFTLKAPRNLGILRNFPDVWGIFLMFCQILGFLVKVTWFLGFSSKNDADSSRNFIKKLSFGTEICEIGPNVSTESWRKVYGIFQDLQDLSRKAYMGPYGPRWAPTWTGPQPGLGPNPAKSQAFL